MGFSLFPKTPKFEELFQQQLGYTVAAARVLEEMCNLSTGFGEKCLAINELEDKGSDVSLELSRQLALTFITPIDREDIHEINKAADKVLSTIKQISIRIGHYSYIPIPAEAKELTTNLRVMLEQVALMLEHLRGKKDVSEHLKKLKQAKKRSDLVLLQAMTDIYKPRELDNQEMLIVIRWSRIYDRLERAIYRTYHLASVIQGVFLKNA
jgi:uncharacterized protein Yka (UPF0111/DUF47 family)